MINMWQAFLNFWRGYINFTGQATRAEYWWMQLWRIILTVGWLILVVIAFAIDAWLSHVGSSLPTHGFGNIFRQLFTHFPITAVVVVLGLILLVAMIIPSISLRIRRYRDAGTTTWFAWVTWLLAAPIGVVGSFTKQDTIIWGSTLFSIISFVLALVATNGIVRWHVIGRRDVAAPTKKHANDTPNDEL